MANFAGSDNALPGPYVDIETLSSGLSIPSGVRLAAIIGEGSRRETIVSGANGNGNDGLNATYTGTNGQDGRHFLLKNYPIISNRTTLYKNGIPLVGIEGAITGSAFSSAYDYKIDTDTGRIELQTASIVDQGGEYYSTSALNVGDGYISSLSLIDSNALSETWTIRCASVLRDGYGVAIDGYSKFTASGSVSGNILDGYGNQVFWMSDGIINSNSVISFAIYEGSTVFHEGDRFGIEIKGGVLKTDDSLVTTYIAVTDLEDPEFFEDMESLAAKHGSPSLTNRLSLGGQICFANSTPGVYAVQAKPAIPRRLSYQILESASGGSGEEDLTFALPINVTPDVDANINFFVTNPTTGVESQLIPNKVDFYNATITASPNANFIANASYIFSYTVILTDAVIKQDNDGIAVDIGAGSSTFTSSAVRFNIEDLSATRQLKVINSSPNDGLYDILDVVDGSLIIDASFDATGVEFQIVDTAIDSSKILFTDDLADQLPPGAVLRATIVDLKDADFYDAGWSLSYEALEKVEVDIVVPLPSQTISAIFQNGASHVRYMSNIKRKRERMLFIGAIRGLTPENVIGSEDAAVEDIGILEGIQGDDVSEILAGNIEDLANYGVQNAYGTTFRVVYFYPDEVVVQIGADRALVDGFFIAAAAAGYLSGTPNIALPLTNKVLTGFTILRNRVYRPITLESIAAKGITVLQPVTGGGLVLKGQTTTNSGFTEEQEISIVFIRDRISKQLRTAFQGFIGMAESPILQSALSKQAKNMLTSFIGQGLITGFRDLKVVRDSVDPTQWNIFVKVQPVYPVNYIYMKVSVGLI